jgi:glycosyltransferase involved in cell wall biosynthesis
MKDYSVSVLMSLFFKENPQYFQEALQSLADQTVLPDEIVIICEGELPHQLHQVLAKYRDIFGDEIFKAVPARSKGFSNCLNEGLQLCSKNWVVRFDTDDICLPHRIEKQLEHLRKNSEAVISSAPLIEFDETMQVQTGIRDVPLEHDAILRCGKWKNPFNHPSTIYRREVVLELGGYPPVKANEDYALFAKLLTKGYVACNYDKPLVKARTGAGLILRRRGRKYLKGEIECLRFMYEIGFLNTYQYLVHLSTKMIIRSMPPFFVKRVYNFLRKESFRRGPVSEGS